MLGRDLPNSKFDPNVEQPTRTMDLFHCGGIAKGKGIDNTGVESESYSGRANRFRFPLARWNPRRQP